MNFLKKKIILDPLHKEDESQRRSFIRKSIAALFGATILTSAKDIYSMESKTGLIYVKQNGEVINDYSPMGESQPFLGEIVAFGCNFEPFGWKMCNGQLLDLGTNTALFSLLGTTFGGDGDTNFALPDLRGRVGLGPGQGSGLSLYVTGEQGGSEGVSLLQTEIPSHNHFITASSGIGISPSPSNTYFAQNAEGISSYRTSSNTVLNSNAIGVTGSGNPHNNIQPVLAMNFCIATQGIFPAHP